MAGLFACDNKLYSNCFADLWCYSITKSEQGAKESIVWKEIKLRTSVIFPDGKKVDQETKVISPLPRLWFASLNPVNGRKFRGSMIFPSILIYHSGI